MQKKKLKLFEKRNFSVDHSKLYPFTPVQSNDASLLEKSFNIKHDKKLNYLFEDINTHFRLKNIKSLPKKPSIQENSKLKELLKKNLEKICNETPLILPSPEKFKIPHQTSNIPNKILQRKTTTFSHDIKKKLTTNKTFNMNESRAIISHENSNEAQEKYQNKKESIKNLIIKQKGLDDFKTKKCQYVVNKKKSVHEEVQESEIYTEKRIESLKQSFSLSLEIVDMIKFELGKPEELRNIMKLDSYLKDLYYLKKFSPFYRKKILRFCHYFEFQQNTILFNDGDIADYVYIILRGAVSIQILNKETANFPIKIKTLYDGEHFGDLNLKANPTESRKRQATCICAEKTFLLGMDQEKLQDLLFDKNEKLQFYYFKFLRGLFIFENIDDFTISNFARNIRRKHFKYGESIINQGEIPQGLHIIFKGSCIALKENLCTRNINPSEFNIRLKPKKTHSNEKSPFKNNEDSRIKYLKKYFNYKKINSNQYQYKEQIFFKKLNDGDIFTGYILFFDIYPNAEDKYSKEATYSVVADDLNVEIWVFEKFLLNFLAKSTLSATLLDLIKSVDLPNEKKQINKNKEEIEKWHNYKLKLYDEKMREHFWIKRKKRNSYFI